MNGDNAFIRRVLRDLIRIDSRNPALEEGAPGEWEAARYVKELLHRLGWEAELHDLGNRRANVTATRAGRGGGPSLMINAHLDTVGVGGMKNPFGGELRNGRLHGRGAQDVKGGVAAALGAAKALSDGGVALRGDLVLAFVADEEHESIGTADVARRVRTDAAVVLEPTDLDVCVAHRGFGIFRLCTRGRAVHGGCSDEGVDANTHMAFVLAEIDDLGRRWRRNHRHRLLGNAALHVPLIAGGRQLYVYSDACRADLECRTVPGQSPDHVLEELRAVFRSVRERRDRFRGSIEPLLWRPPYEIDPARPVVRAVRAAAEEVRGGAPRLIGHPWWEDAALLGGAGIESVVIGPRGGGLHTADEWVDPESVVDLAGILFGTVIRFCGRA